MKRTAKFDRMKNLSSSNREKMSIEKFEKFEVGGSNVNYLYL